MTEPDNTPEFDPATDADSVSSEEAVEVTPEAPVEETPAAPVEESVEVAPAEPEVSQTEEQAEATFNAPEVDAQPVSGVPSSSAAVSDKPVQTDNRERPEDGEQDVSQDPTEVPSNDEDPDVVA